ncbi:(R)-citramalate synthase [uncultured Candidatus Thioglobus sp.]|nr:(R)-citramalate synthase [uncultured Candidatus Thioglobus sp.]
MRDGEQTQGVSFSPAEKVSIAKALLESLRVDRIEIASACVSDGEQEAVRSINEWAQIEGFGGAVEVLGFVDHKRSVDWVVATSGQVINLLAKGSEKHCREQLGKTLEGHVQQVLNTINYALESGLKVNIYLEDWSNGYADNPEYVFAFMDAIKDSGIEHFMLPDTLGVMSPEEVFDALSDMCARYPDVQFDFHPHNDYGLGTANIMAAVRAGISAIHCTVNCLGERAGNASVSEVTVVLRDKMGMKLSIDESNIVRLSNMVENFSGKWVAANAPIIGDDVFTQTAGIHADGDKKGGLYESKLSPERFARTRSYALGKMSGKASLSKNLELLGIDLSEENQGKVLERIVRLGDSKQTITTEDLPFIIADVLENESYKHIKLLDCSITSRLDESSVAIIKVDIKGKEHTSEGIGNGGFDAFIGAVNKVLDEYDTVLPELADYEVRIPKGGHTNALTECVITWENEFKKRKTRGVHSNQVFASILAALRMINIQLHEKQ